ncbi:MAG: peptidoglycan DD-metalloendopeptidase family protein [Anaerolineae bacterium]|nr:peptidoglycan DD-metalloendopeptidase family protein [Anaerolineae bacterium]
MDEPPSKMWLNYLVATLRRGARACRQAWRALLADGRYRYFQIGAVLLVAALLSLQLVGPGPASVPVGVDRASPLPGATLWSIVAPTAVSTPARPLRGVRESYASSGGMVVTRQPTRIPAIESPLPTHAAIPAEPDDGVTIYTVREGDDLASIARWFGLQRETLIWSNETLEVDAGHLYVGQQLYILPIDGVYYTVQRGDSLNAIAAQFQVSVEAIADSEYNAAALQGGALLPGQRLIIPGGSKPFQALVVSAQSQPVESETPLATGRWVWPVGGYISQGYWDLHRAIDIAGAHGSTVLAADGGTVTYAFWNVAGYGNLVIVDHGNGFVSYYAHLYGFYVDVGDRVEQGQPVGALGNTGFSTGPHLHFEIRHHGTLCNPIDLLPQ